jgi:hypothetical protein
VQVDFKVTHFQSLEGAQLTEYTYVTIAAFVLSFVVLMEKVVTVRNLIWRQVRYGFALDLMIQVVMPVIYFSIRYDQVLRSKSQILETIGVQGLAGVPWASRDVLLRDKINLFLDNITKLQALNATEQIMRYFYFLLSAAQLLRLIMQTSAHPRTAILVNTRKFGVLFGGCSPSNVSSAEA